MAVVLSQGFVADGDPGAVSGGRERASGAGGADGRDVGAAGRRHRDGAPRFDQPVQPGGYLWWYLDAVSDDGRYALTIIAFVGSVFSPYYARAFERAGTAVDPEDHVCMNVALYGAGGHRWAMTERGRPSLSRSASGLTVGASSLRWNGRWFDLSFDERECPWPRRLRGVVRIHPRAFTSFRADLDDQGLHRWGPVAPCAQVEVEVDGGPRWKGHGYLDSNEGDEPIHRPFERWDWSRSTDARGHTSVIYDVQCKSGAQRLVQQRFAPDGRSDPFDAPPRQVLPKTAWGIARSMRCDPDFKADVVKVFENTPFYVRDLVRTSLGGEVLESVHESLDARRVASWLVRLMLPFRMPRLA